MKHVFDRKAFRRQRLPLFVLAMLPSLILDGYLAYSIVFNLPSFFIPVEAGSFGEAVSPFVANLLLLKAPLIYAYVRLRMQRLESYVRVDDKQVVYRKNRLIPAMKLYQTYAYHDEFYLSNITDVIRRISGAIVVRGEIHALRKHHGVEAVSRRWITKRLVIPPYYKDMDGIALKLKSLTTQE